ncbi:hypothetical protein ONZ45_g7456 [Pleurotus djamor]|nr:hypothetical protein ONZ45_g7456 [Pleurotus djamor]
MALSLGRVVFISRYVAFVTIILSSLIAAAISAHFLALTKEYFGGYLYFSPLVLAVGGLSFLSLLICFVLDITTRSKVFSSKIAFEIGWLSFLFVAWMGAAGYSEYSNEQAFGDDRECNFRSRTLRDMCYELPVIVAFSFLAGFVIFAYVMLLIAYSFIWRNHNVMGMSVREASLLHVEAAASHGIKTDYHTHPQPGGYPAGTSPATGYYTQGVPPMQYPGGIVPPSPYSQNSSLSYQTAPFQPPNTQFVPASMYPQPQGPEPAYPNYQGPTPPNAPGYVTQPGFQQPQFTK